MCELKSNKTFTSYFRSYIARNVFSGSLKTMQNFLRPIILWKANYTDMVHKLYSSWYNRTIARNVIEYAICRKWGINKPLQSNAVKTQRNILHRYFNTQAGCTYKQLPKLYTTSYCTSPYCSLDNLLIVHSTIMSDSRINFVWLLLPP